LKKSIGFLKYALKMVLVKGEWFDLYCSTAPAAGKQNWDQKFLTTRICISNKDSECLL